MNNDDMALVLMFPVYQYVSLRIMLVAKNGNPGFANLLSVKVHVAANVVAAADHCYLILATIKHD